MVRSPVVYLSDMQEAIDEVEKTVSGIDFESYKRDWQKRRAVERGLEIISESSRHIPDDLKALAPDVPWKQIAGIGNILRHEYHRVDDQAVWNIVKIHLPKLASGLQKLVTSL